MSKIVIIEDDRAILEMYCLKFQSEGFTVYHATNGEDGLKVLSGTNPDIILLDLMMPIMDGKTMLKHLRKTPWGKDIPVFIMTNMSKDEAPKDLEELGVADYIIKANTTPHSVFEKVQATIR